MHDWFVLILFIRSHFWLKLSSDNIHQAMSGQATPCTWKGIDVEVFFELLDIEAKRVKAEMQNKLDELRNELDEEKKKKEVAEAEVAALDRDKKLLLECIGTVSEGIRKRNVL